MQENNVGPLFNQYFYDISGFLVLTIFKIVPFDIEAKKSPVLLKENI